MGPVPWVDPGESFISVRAKTDGLSKEKPSSISGWLLGWATWLKKGVWAKRCSTLFAGNEFSDAEVAANVLAANGWEGRKVHANCSLDLRWTSAHEWASRLLKKYCCTTRACWWKIQRSLSPGTLVLRLFSWAWPCGIILRESASMPQSLSGRTAGAEKGSAASGELRDFHTEICHHVHCLSLKEKKGLKIQVICRKRWLHLADFRNSDGVMIRAGYRKKKLATDTFSSISVPERSFFFFIPILRNEFQQDYIISKIEMHRLQFSWPIPISDFLEVWPANTDFCRFRFSFDEL